MPTFRFNLVAPLEVEADSETIAADYIVMALSHNLVQIAPCPQCYPVPHEYPIDPIPAQALNLIAVSPEDPEWRSPTKVVAKDLGLKHVNIKDLADTTEDYTPPDYVPADQVEE